MLNLRLPFSNLTIPQLFRKHQQPSNNFYYLEKKPSNHYLQELLFSRKIKSRNRRSTLKHFHLDNSLAGRRPTHFFLTHLSHHEVSVVPSSSPLKCCQGIIVALSMFSCIHIMYFGFTDTSRIRAHGACAWQDSTTAYGVD
jgi:hypothetical protein